MAFGLWETASCYKPIIIIIIIIINTRSSSVCSLALNGSAVKSEAIPIWKGNIFRVKITAMCYGAHFMLHCHPSQLTAPVDSDDSPYSILIRQGAADLHKTILICGLSPEFHEMACLSLNQ
jgi:hypothetical protein